MIIYEKEHKLNIDFSGKITGNPEIVIGKDEDGVAKIMINNQDATIPTIDEESYGKVLGVNTNGELEWVTDKEGLFVIDTELSSTSGNAIANSALFNRFSEIDASVASVSEVAMDAQASVSEAMSDLQSYKEFVEQTYVASADYETFKEGQVQFNGSVASTVSNLQDYYAMARASISSLSTGLSATDSTVSNLSTQLSGLSSSVSALQSDFTLSKQDLEEIKSLLPTLSESIESVNASVSTLTSKYESTSATVSGMLSSLQTISETVDGLQTVSASLDESVNKLNSSVRELYSTVSSLSGQVDTINEWVEEILPVIDGKASTDYVDSSVSALSSVIDTTVATVSALSTVVNSHVDDSDIHVTKEDKEKWNAGFVIPEIPPEDGKYVLTCEVKFGNVVFMWEGATEFKEEDI